MRYDSIFNVVNESDAYTYIMPQSAGFSRYGVQVVLNQYSKRKTTKEAIDYIKGKDKSSGYNYNSNRETRMEIEKAFNRIFKKDMERVRKLYIEDKGLQKALEDIIQKFISNESLIFAIQNINNNVYKIDEEIKPELVQFATLLNTKYNTNTV